MHKGSLGTKEHITDWVAPDIFLSKRDKWGRMGFLGMFADYVLSSIQGDVAEIGFGESSIYLAYAAKKYNRRIYHCDIEPSKIGNAETVPGYWPEGIDKVLFKGPSDKLFAEAINTNLAFTFIDGDHNYAQARKDFENAVSRTVENGYIALHDTYPLDDSFLNENRCGDVYKLRQELELMRNQFDCITLTQGCAMNVGLTIVRKKPLRRVYYHE